MTAKIAKIDATRCSGCGRCISACEFRLFAFETRAWKKTSVMHNADQCSGCGECAARCVIGAISMCEEQAYPGRDITPQF
ncbi:MAG: FeS-binding protein [Betaproteobacteria bacterium HGW-Betaproteobacteria-18]|nr:MAG: FeS-binding protein [Betaproteobacteria bacterium HGW-Betaproteobacteria-18]